MALGLAACTTPPSPAPLPDIAEARALIDRGALQRAHALLMPLAQQQPGDTELQLLLTRIRLDCLTRGPDVDNPGFCTPLRPVATASPAPATAPSAPAPPPAPRRPDAKPALADPQGALARPVTLQFSDATLRGQIKENKPSSFMGLMGGGTYLEAKFAEDAELVQEFYLNKGYVQARVGNPQVETLQDSRDRKTRWIRLKHPVDEGKRFRIGTLKVTENTAVSAETLRRFFKIQEGEYYSYAEIKKGLDKISELYGAVGYFQFAPDVEQAPRGIDPKTGEPTGPGEPPAIVDVTVRLVEGKRFYVTRIEFLGNTTAS